MSARWTRPLAAALAAGGFLAPILAVLMTRVPGTARTPIAEEFPQERGLVVDIRGRASVEMDGILFVHRTSLTTSNPVGLAAHEQIRLRVVGYDSEPELHDAALQFAGTTCAYRTRTGTRFPDDGLLTFVRGAGCAPMQGQPTGEIALDLRFSRAARVGLWTYARQEPNVPPDAVIVSKFGLPPSSDVLIARGTMVDEHPEASASRLALLAYVWQLSDSPRWIVLCLMGAAFGIFGAVMLGWRARDANAGTRRGLRGPAAPFVAALALSGTYAVVVPPFQAADEPNHFLAFAESAGRPDWARDALTLAERGHFGEISHDATRHFSPLDRGAPGAPWQGVNAPSTVRGAGAEILWIPFAAVLGHAQGPQALLALRLFHALIFSAAVGLFLLAVDQFTDARVPELLAIPLFLIPTLPFFGMHVSNYAPLLSLYVVFAAGVAVACWDGPRSHFAAPLLAAGLTGAIAMSRSAVPVIPMAALIVFARVFMGDRQARRRPAVLYWTGLIAAIVAGMAVVNWAHAGGLERSVARLPIAESPLVKIVRHPWWVALPCAALLAVEVGLTALRQRVGPGLRAYRQPAVRIAAYGAAGLLLVGCTASWWIPYPTLAPLDGAKPVAFWTYVKDCAVACLTSFRFGRPDDLTSLTFWGGFGWLETLLPWRLVSVLAGTSGAALAALLWWIGRTGSGRALFWVACALAGYALSMATYAVSARTMFADLHGRYLLGIYLAGLVVAWSVTARVAESGGMKPGVLTAAAGIGCLLVHTYAVCFIVSRYF